MRTVTFIIGCALWLNSSPLSLQAYQEPPPRNPSPSPGGRRGWEQPLEKSVTGKFIKALKKVRGEK